MIKIIKGSVFPYDIMVAYNCNLNDIKNKLKKFKQELDEEKIEFLKSSSLASTIQLPCKAVLIYFKGKITQGLIAHEVYHAVIMIFNTMGIDYSSESEEAFAYMIEYYVDNINKLLDNKKK